MWSRRLLATLEDGSSIPGARNNNLLGTRSVWPTLVSSVCCASLVQPPLDLDYKQGIRNCVESTIQPGSHQGNNKGIIYTHFTPTMVSLGKLHTIKRTLLRLLCSTFKQRLPTHYMDHLPTELLVMLCVVIRIAALYKNHTYLHCTCDLFLEHFDLSLSLKWQVI